MPTSAAARTGRHQRPSRGRVAGQLHRGDRDEQVALDGEVGDQPAEPGEQRRHLLSRRAPSRRATHEHGLQDEGRDGDDGRHGVHGSGAGRRSPAPSLGCPPRRNVRRSARGRSPWRWPMMVRMTTDTHVPVVQAERNALCDSLLALGPDAPTLCDPWRTRDLAAHLVLREHQPVLATGIWFAPLEGRMERGQARAGGRRLHRRWSRRCAPGRRGGRRRTSTKVDALLNTTELVIHHEDALRGDGAVGPRREVPERTARAVLVGPAQVGLADVPPRAASGCGSSRPAPSRSPPGKGASVVTVTGAPVELLLLASGRMRVADVELDGVTRGRRDPAGTPGSASPDLTSEGRELSRRPCRGAEVLAWRGNFGATGKVSRRHRGGAVVRCVARTGHGSRVPGVPPSGGASSTLSPGAGHAACDGHCSLAGVLFRW